MVFFTMRKTKQFHIVFSGLEILWKRTVSVEFRANVYVFPQNFQNRKLCEIMKLWDIDILRSVRSNNPEVF